MHQSNVISIDTAKHRRDEQLTNKIWPDKFWSHACPALGLVTMAKGDPCPRCKRTDGDDAA